MNALILTEGGGNRGFGHITRCLALYDALADGGIQTDMMINADETVQKLLEGKSYEIRNWKKEEKKLVDIVLDKDIIIVDSYLAPKKTYETIIKANIGVAAFIDDYNRITYPGGSIVINPSIYGDKIGYEKGQDRVYHVGKKYIIVRKEFQKGFVGGKTNRKVKDILVTLGGGDNRILGKKIVENIRQVFDFNIHKINPMETGVEAKEMLDLMLTSDICITGGGQTLNELSRVGVPSIAVGLAENQIENIKGWLDAGFIQYAGWHTDDKIGEKIINCMKRLIDYEKRMRISEIGCNTVDGKGAVRIVNALLEG